MEKCFVCQKALPQGEGVVSEIENISICTCKDHVRQGKFWLAVRRDLLFILNDQNNFALIWKIIAPTVHKNGIEKVSHYLQDNRQYWSNYLEKKTFSTIRAKALYFNKILENNIPQYQYTIEEAYYKNLDDGSKWKTIAPKRKRKKTLNEIINGVRRQKDESEVI